MTEKRILTLDEIESQTTLELPDREMMAVAVGGLAAVAIDRIDVRVNIPVDVDVNNNNICVALAAVASAAGCGQRQ